VENIHANDCFRGIRLPVKFMLVNERRIIIIEISQNDCYKILLYGAVEIQLMTHENTMIKITLHYSTA